MLNVPCFGSVDVQSYSLDSSMGQMHPYMALDPQSMEYFMLVTVVAQGIKFDCHVSSPLPQSKCSLHQFGGFDCVQDGCRSVVDFFGDADCVGGPTMVVVGGFLLVVWWKWIQGRFPTTTKTFLLALGCFPVSFWEGIFICWI